MKFTISIFKFNIELLINSDKMLGWYVYDIMIVLDLKSSCFNLEINI